MNRIKDKVTQQQVLELFEDGNVPCFIPRRSKIVTTKMNANVMFTTIEKVEALWPEVFV